MGIEILTPVLKLYYFHSDSSWGREMACRSCCQRSLLSASPAAAFAAPQLFPQYFLLIASIANAAKSISYMMRLPPRAAILQTFALRQNVGDISAKANSQEARRAPSPAPPSSP